MTIYEVIKRPMVTEKGVAKKDSERTLCFEVAPDANKTAVKAAVRAVVQGESGGCADRRARRASCGGADSFPATARIGRRPMCG